MTVRASRELPLVLALLAVAVAMFHGDAAGDGMVPWLGTFALVAIVVAAALQGVPRGFLFLAPFAVLVTWLVFSIWWSTQPDRSWNYGDRSFVYLAFAALGLWLGTRTRELAYGLAALLGAVVLWSLGGKVFPLGSLPVIGVQSRLDSPVGLWNQLALLGDFALPLALWIGRSRRVLGALLAFLWGVAIVLTLSRGGLAVAVLVVAAWLFFTDDRLHDAGTVVAAAVPAAIASGVAFALSGVTGDHPSSHVRWHDGLIFGAVLLVCALLAAWLARLPRPRGSQALRRGLFVLAGIAVAVLVAAAVVKGGDAWRSFTSSSSVGNSGPRFSASSNLRWVWWKQAWDGFDHHVVAGTGAGSFHVTNLRYRTSYLDVTSEPHDLPVQFLSESGVIGFLLFGAAMVALLLRGHRRRGHELALALFLPAFLLHGLVDIDWDFVAVASPAFLAAGALIGRPSDRRVGSFVLLPAAGVAIALAGILYLPWLGERWASDALFSVKPAQADTYAKRAKSVDPLLVEPYWARADAADERKQYGDALYYYGEATRVQPHNADAWLNKAEYELGLGCARHALNDFYTFNALNPYAAPNEGPNDYRRALRLVNTGKPVC
ncbi:MAG TPA: O-antigen ligase family protein [Gaiellaceae bacterium]|nr:O-antigen ligase family protein [Gaiellaceae bacterium]